MVLVLMPGAIVEEPGPKKVIVLHTGKKRIPKLPLDYPWYCALPQIIQRCLYQSSSAVRYGTRSSIGQTSCCGGFNLTTSYYHAVGNRSALTEFSRNAATYCSRPKSRSQSATSIAVSPG